MLLEQGRRQARVEIPRIPGIQGFEQSEAVPNNHHYFFVYLDALHGLQA